MKNSFIIGAKYNASQNISRLSLAKGNVPLFYQGLVYKGFDPETSEHLFEYQNETKWFDDDFINNGKVEDNSMIFSESESESVSSKPKLFKVSPEIQTSGTHYQGIIYGLTYQKIIDIFGEPCFTGEMGVDKVQADWSIEGEVNGEKVVWIRESLSNFKYACMLGLALYEEYQFRYNKPDKHQRAKNIFEFALKNPPAILDKGLTPFALAMDEKYIQHQSPIENYRNYYRIGKQHLFTWKNRQKPHFI